MMKKHTALTAAVVTLMGTAGAIAQTDQPASPPPGQPGSNPALRYWAAWNSMDAERLSTVRDWNFEENPTPTFGVSVALADLQPEIMQIVEAAEADGCDWGIDFNQGWETLLPHLGHLRRSCQLLRADARRLAAAGMTDDSVRRVEAVFEISADACESPVLISSLVGVACAALGVGEVEHMIDARTLTQDGKNRLLAALRGVDDEFGIIESIEIERGIVDEWLLQKFPGEEGPAQLAAYLDNWSEEDFHDQIAVMSQEEFHASIKRASTAYDRIIEMWDEPNAADLFAEFEKSIQAGEYGLIAKGFLPSIGRIQESRSKIVDQLNSAIERLEAYEPERGAPKETGES